MGLKKTLKDQYLAKPNCACGPGSVGQVWGLHKKDCPVRSKK